MKNNDICYAVRNGEGLFYTEGKHFDKQIRKAKLYVSLNYAKDVIFNECGGVGDIVTVKTVLEGHVQSFDAVTAIENYLDGLVGDAVSCITDKKIVEVSGATTRFARLYLSDSKRVRLRSYGVRCPECDTLIREGEGKNKFDCITHESETCYNCSATFEAGFKNIVPIYELKPDAEL